MQKIKNTVHLAEAAVFNSEQTCKEKKKTSWHGLQNGPIHSLGLELPKLCLLSNQRKRGSRRKKKLYLFRTKCARTPSPFERRRRCRRHRDISNTTYCNVVFKMAFYR